jgi:16S rRNA (guanine527-N7)-methyltransferase
VDFAVAFEVTRETTDRLAIYEAMLRQWQKTINLVAPSTLDHIWHRHFADSAQLLELAPRARAWVDLGSGAGFPGLVIAILLAEGAHSAAEAGDQAPRPGGPAARGAITPAERLVPPRITLIESNARKCAFLREVARQTGIQPRVAVDILSTRIELAATQASLQQPEVVSARALAPLTRLFGMAAGLFAPSTVGLFLKGRDAVSELRTAEKAWKFDAELVPSRTEADASVVVVRNLAAKSKADRSA